MGIAVSLALLLIGITAYFGYKEVFEGLKTFYSVFRGIYGADITTTITVVFGILSIIMIFFWNTDKQSTEADRYDRSYATLNKGSKGVRDVPGVYV